MQNIRLRFLSSNKRKIVEVRHILQDAQVDVIPISCHIDEIQTHDVQGLVRDKCLKAYRLVGRPIFVEQTGLYLHALHGFPAGLTRIFWDCLGAERVCALFGQLADPRAEARTCIGYCDGRSIRHFEGKVEGRIARSPRGERHTAWDCIFIPDGQDQTFAEMDQDRKNRISMRAQALAALAGFLKDPSHVR